jgi:hypothetical protein
MGPARAYVQTALERELLALALAQPTGPFPLRGLLLLDPGRAS